MQGGTKAELNIGKLLMKRGSVIAASLRGRPVDGKGAIAAAVREHVWPMIADGRVRPIVHATLPMPDAAAAHALFDDGGVIGKVLLTVPGR
jgi:NADPH:quinone reductase-like Zn-dependent oxidoreductase